MVAPPVSTASKACPSWRWSTIFPENPCGSKVSFSLFSPVWKPSTRGTGAAVSSGSAEEAQMVYDGN